MEDGCQDTKCTKPSEASDNLLPGMERKVKKMTAGFCSVGGNALLSASHYCLPIATYYRDAVTDCRPW